MIQAQTIDATRIGPALVLISPLDRRLTRECIDTIELALEFEDLGDLGAAQGLLRRLGRDRGLHRQWLRAASLIPQDEAPFTSHEISSLQRAEARANEAKIHQAAGNHRLARARTVEARRLLVDIEILQRGRSDTRWAERVLGEITALEQAIGGATDRPRLAQGQPLQIASRDGLYMLSVPRKVTGPDGKPVSIARVAKGQYAAGVQYRELYEKTDPERTLRPPAIDPADIRSTPGGEGWEEKRRKLWDDRKRIDAQIKAKCGAQALWLLQEIAGKGRCIAHLAKEEGKSGRTREDYTQQVVGALECLAVIYGM